MTGAFSVEDISIAVHRRSGLDTALGEELVREQIGTIEQAEGRVIGARTPDGGHGDLIQDTSRSLPELRAS